jgi:hypothetical protein
MFLFFFATKFMREVKRNLHADAFTLKYLDYSKLGTFLNGNVRRKDSNACVRSPHSSEIRKHFSFDPQFLPSSNDRSWPLQYCQNQTRIETRMEHGYLFPHVPRKPPPVQNCRSPRSKPCVFRSPRSTAAIFSGFLIPMLLGSLYFRSP